MKIENAIVCDHIRKEDSGKHLLIGVYPHIILFSSFPGKVLLSTWVQISDDGNRIIGIEYRVIDSDSKILALVKGEFDATDQSGLITITLPPVPLDISGETILSFQMREPKKHWKTLKQMPVALRQKN